MSNKRLSNKTMFQALWQQNKKNTLLLQGELWELHGYLRFILAYLLWSYAWHIPSILLIIIGILNSISAILKISRSKNMLRELDK